MIDLAYRTITQLLDQDSYQEALGFHAKTNHFTLIDGSNGETEALNQSADFQLLEHSDLPICPFDASRIDLDKFKTFPKFLSRKPSIAGFTDRVVPASDIMKLLQSAFGADMDAGIARRPYPSSGALYSVQVIIGIRAKRVNESQSQSSKWLTGFYHYRPNLHALDLLKRVADETLPSLLLNKQDMERFCRFNFCLFYTACLGKAMCKYGYRGYRLALLEAGSMYQHATLCANSLGLMDRVWPEFNDFEVNKTLGLDPISHLPLIAQIFGYPYV